MKYILRILWIIGYIPVFILANACFFIMLFIYPLAEAFYFIKTGDCEKVPFDYFSLSGYIDKKYRELLKYLRL